MADLFCGIKEIGLGADGVNAGDGNAGGFEFHAQGFGQRKLGGFGGAVDTEIGNAAAGGGGGDDDDLAAETVDEVLLTQDRDGGADAIGGAEDVGLENLLDFLSSGVGDAVDDAVAGVADKRVEPAGPLLGGGDETGTVGFDGNVGRDDQMLAAKLAVEFFQTILPARRENEACAALGQIDRQGASDAGAGAGDDHDHSGEVSVHTLTVTCGAALTTGAGELTTGNCMFTGIVERSLPLMAATDGPSFRRLTIQNVWPDVKAGDSIALNGVCLTVAEISAASLGFDVIPETLAKTNLGLLKPGDPIHIERAMLVGSRIDGHFVQGHVDATATLLEIITAKDEFRLKVETPANLAKYLIPKGSVTLDGVSLTIAAINGDSFEVALIPTTLAITSLGKRPAHWPLNIECDVMAKTIVTYLERMKGSLS